jgi:hypothetical protein
MNRIALAAFAMLLCASLAHGQEAPGQLIARGEFFSVYAPEGTDPYKILAKIDYDYLVHADSLRSREPRGTADMLASALDGLYREVSDILDIHIYSFRGTVVFVLDQPSLTGFLKKQFNLDFDERSIYYHEKNTIYVSIQDMTLGMVGHEMAHAIISHYFVVPPPPKLQEVLSGYVEYTLRKNHRS